MLLTLTEILTLLRSSVNVQYLDSETTDSAYLSMSDEDLLIYVKLGCSNAFPKVKDLNSLPRGAEYPIVLLAKIELYSALAVLKANMIDLTADQNNQLKQSQRFTHYMALVQEARTQYQNWVADNGFQEVNSFSTFIAREHYSKRTATTMNTPEVSVHIDSLTTNEVELSWDVEKSQLFSRYLVYLSKETILDQYNNNTLEGISSSATLVKKTYDARNNLHRLTGLEPETTYHILIVSQERNTVFGSEEITLTTLAEVEEEPEVDVSDVGGTE